MKDLKKKKKETIVKKSNLNSHKKMMNLTLCNISLIDQIMNDLFLTSIA